MSRRTVFSLLLTCVALVSLGVTRPSGLADIVAVRHWSYPDYTRVVVELSREVQTDVHHLAANASADKPERLYLDLPGFWVGRDYAAGVAVGDGLLRAVRLGQNTKRTTRVVIDVEQYERHRMLVLTHPDRLVIDVYGPRSARKGRGGTFESRIPRDLRDLRTVVVDPGHGGTDPGAIGIGGLREKDITLRLARALRPKLEANDFRVVLTRNDDRAVSLEERTAIAEAAQGDVFVSLHANAARRRNVQGVETYYPDQNHERHSLRVAMRENGVTRSQLDDLQRTLAKLRLAEISPRSRRLASLVQTELTRRRKGRYGEIQDLGAKKGPFYVLFLSDMPAILVEAGFVTNRDDAKRLSDKAYLEVVATHITQGLLTYRGDSGQVAQRGAR